MLSIKFYKSRMFQVLIVFLVTLARQGVSQCVNIGCEGSSWTTWDYPQFDPTTDNMFVANEGQKSITASGFGECTSQAPYTDFRTYPPQQTLLDDHGIMISKSTFSNDNNDFTVTWPTSISGPQTVHLDKIALFIFQKTASGVIAGTTMTYLYLQQDGSIPGACGSSGADPCTSNAVLENSICGEFVDQTLPAQIDIVHELQGGSQTYDLLPVGSGASPGGTTWQHFCNTYQKLSAIACQPAGSTTYAFTVGGGVPAGFSFTTLSGTPKLTISSSDQTLAEQSVLAATLTANSASPESFNIYPCFIDESTLQWSVALQFKTGGSNVVVQMTGSPEELGDMARCGPITFDVQTTSGYIEASTCQLSTSASGCSFEVKVSDTIVDTDILIQLNVKRVSDPLVIIISVPQTIYVRDCSDNRGIVFDSPAFRDATGTYFDPFYVNFDDSGQAIFDLQQAQYAPAFSTCGPVDYAFSATLQPQGTDALSYVTLLASNSQSQVVIDKASRISTEIEQQLEIKLRVWYVLHSADNPVTTSLNIVEVICDRAFGVAIEDQVLYTDLESGLVFEMFANQNVWTGCPKSLYINGPDTGNVPTDETSLTWINRGYLASGSNLIVDTQAATSPLDSLIGTYAVQYFEGDQSLDFDLHLCQLITEVAPPTTIVIDLEQNPDTITVSHGSFTFNPASGCGQPTFEASDDYFFKSGAARIVDDELVFHVSDHPDLYKVGSYPFTFKVLAPTGQAIIEVLITIDIPSCNLSSLDFTDTSELANFQLEPDVTQTVVFGPVRQSPRCNYPVTLTLTMIEQTDSQVEVVFDQASDGHTEFATLDTVTKTITFGPVDSNDVYKGKTFAYFIRAAALPSPTEKTLGPYYVSILADDVLKEQFVPENLPPQIDEFVDYVEVVAGRPSSWLVGYPFDSELDGFDVLPLNVTLAMANEWTFLAYDFDTSGLLLTVDAPVDTPLNTTFTALITLAENGVDSEDDDDLLESVFEITVVVVDTDSDTDETEDLPSSLDTILVSTEPNDSKADHLSNENLPAKTIQRDKKVPLEVSLSATSPSITGHFSLVFNRYVVLPFNVTDWTRSTEQSLQIELQLSGETLEVLEERDETMVMTWTVVGVEQRDVLWSSKSRMLQEDSFTEVKEIEIQVSFTHPDYISQGLKAKDKVLVTPSVALLQHELLFRPETIVDQDKLETPIELKLKKQVTSQAVARAIREITEATQTAVLGFASSNYLVSLVFSNLIQFLWGIINTLQLIMLTVLFQVNMPVNSYEIMIQLLKITNLDVIDTNVVLQKIITLEETPAFSPIFEDAGYETSNFLLELGPLLFFLIAGVILVGVKMLVSKLIKARCSTAKNCIVSYFEKKTFAQALMVRFFLEGCVEIGLSALIAIVNINGHYFHNFAEGLSTVLLFLTLIALVIAPTRLAKSAKTYTKEQEDKVDLDNQSPLSKYFRPFRTERLSLMYTVIFFCRRYTLLLTIVLLKDYFLVQIFVHIFLTLAMMAYLWQVSPFKGPSINTQEIVNEGFILLTAYPLLTFNEWISSMDTRMINGWVLISMICISVTFNMAILLFETIAQTYKSCRRRIVMGQRKQQYEEMQRKRKLYWESMKQFDAVPQATPRSFALQLVKCDLEKPVAQGKRRISLRRSSLISLKQDIKMKSNQDSQLINVAIKPNTKFWLNPFKSSPKARLIPTKQVQQMAEMQSLESMELAPSITNSKQNSWRQVVDQSHSPFNNADPSFAQIQVDAYKPKWTDVPPRMNINAPIKLPRKPFAMTSYGMAGEESKVPLSSLVSPQRQYQSNFDVDKLIKELDDFKVTPIKDNDYQLAEQPSLLLTAERPKPSTHISSFPIEFDDFKVGESRLRKEEPEIFNAMYPQRQQEPKFKFTGVNDFFSQVKERVKLAGNHLD